MRKGSAEVGMFDLPKEEKRIQSDSWFQQLNAVKPQYRHDTGFYIIYRAGRDLRCLTWFFGITVFLLACLHRYWGIMPSLSDYPSQKDFLGFYLHYINFSGPVIFLCLIYYFIWFKKNISFSEYNLLKHSPKKNYKEFSLFEIIVFVLVGVAGGIAITIRPSLISSFFYLDIFHGFFYGFFENGIFVLIVSLMIVYIHTLFAQCLILFSIILSFIYYQYKNELWEKGVDNES